MDHEIPCNRLDSCDQSDVESIWISLRPHKLPREITSIILGVIYHSTSNYKEPKNVVLRDHVQNNLDSLLFKKPKALVLLTGDFNASSTGFKMKYITQVNHLKQLISFKTRDSAVLDWLLTNRPKLFEVSRLPKVGTSDHYTILAKPNIDRFHLTSRRPYWCTKTMKWRPYWCTVRELALSYSNISYCFTTPLGPPIT